MENGVKIYEYTPGFIHAKTFISDDKTAVVGTINMDFRSLYLHFECATYMREIPCIEQIKSDLDDLFENKCKEVTMYEVEHRNIFGRLYSVLLKMLALLM